MGDDDVVDAACGSGYGKELMGVHWASYYGFDKEPPTDIWEHEWQAEDLETWTVPPTIPIDVFVGFETIEHLRDYTAYLKVAKSARKWIIMSVPVVPTKHINPWHLHDFEPGQLQALLEDETWEHYQTVQQPSEFSEIVVMRRRT